MATAYNPGIVTSGLVLCLDAGNAKSYPGSGTTWTDLSGNSNTATLVNATFSSNSIVFDGTSTYATIPYTATISNQTSFTLSCWMKSSSIATEQVLFSTTNAPTFANGWHLEVYQSKPLFQPFPSGTSYQSSTTLTSNTWYNIAATYSSGYVTIYVNGANAGSGTVPTFTASSITIYLGRYNTGSYKFSGNLAAIKFYSSVLTAAEVLQNFNALRGRFGL